MSRAARPQDTWATGLAAILTVEHGICPVCRDLPTRPECDGAMAAVSIGATLLRLGTTAALCPGFSRGEDIAPGDSLRLYGAAWRVEIDAEGRKVGIDPTGRWAPILIEPQCHYPVMAP